MWRDSNGVQHSVAITDYEEAFSPELVQRVRRASGKELRATIHKLDAYIDDVVNRPKLESFDPQEEEQFEDTYLPEEIVLTVDPNVPDLGEGVIAALEQQSERWHFELLIGFFMFAWDEVDSRSWSARLRRWLGAK